MTYRKVLVKLLVKENGLADLSSFRVGLGKHNVNGKSVGENTQSVPFSPGRKI
jgi:hypothetical protein